MTYQNGRLPGSALAPIPGGRLAKDAARAWNEMNAESEFRFGVTLLPAGPLSSYRDLAGQEKTWATFQAGGPTAARPGTSNHGLGLAVDLKTPGMRTIVNQIGEKYGFAKRWSDASGEWWHIVYRHEHYRGADKTLRWRIELKRRRGQLKKARGGARAFLIRRITQLKKALGQ